MGPTMSGKRGSSGSPRLIGAAAKFFLERFWVQTVIGPYVLTTVESRPGVYDTTVTWGEDGPEVDAFGSGQSFDETAAQENHEEVEASIVKQIGAGSHTVLGNPPFAA